MTFNVRRFSTAAMLAEFLDASGAITLPTSASLTITYPTTSGGTASASISMVPTGYAFIGNWGAGVSALGLASFSIVAPAQTTPATGNIRVLSSHV